MTTGNTNTDEGTPSAPGEMASPAEVIPGSDGRNIGSEDASSDQEAAAAISATQVTDGDAKPELTMAYESCDDEDSFAHDGLSDESSDDDDDGKATEPQVQKSLAAAPEPSSGATDEDPAKKKHSLGPYSRREYTFAICAGSVMAFNSGYVNGSCLTGFIAPSGRSQATASLTGTTSRSALALGDGRYEDFGFGIGMVLSFFIGAFISGLMAPFPTPFRMEPSYGPTFRLGAAFLVLSSILAACEIHEDFVFFLAAAANGIQNGISSIYSGKLIRSTGYAGAITDISIVLAQISQGNRENAWKLGVLVTLLASFWVGGAVSYYSAKRFTSFSLLINAGIFVMIGGSLVAFLMIEFGITLRQAVTGSWKWHKAMESLQGAFIDTSIFVPRGIDAGDSDDEDGDSVGPLARIGSCSTHKKSFGKLSERHLNQIFTRLDKDNSNTLDQSELFAALQNAGMAVTRRDCHLMMRRADVNGDGVLSRDEWIQIARECEKKPKTGALLASSWHASTHKCSNHK